MKLGTAFFWLSLNYVVVANTGQTGPPKLPENDKLKKDIYFQDKNSLICGIVCRTSDTCNGFNYTRPAGCQCKGDAALSRDAPDEGLKPPMTTNISVAQHSIAYAICIYNKIYWYKGGSLLYETKHRFAGANYEMFVVDYVQSTKTIYWLSCLAGLFYSIDISFGKLITKTHLMLRGAVLFKVDSDRSILFWTTRSDLRRSNLKGQKTRLLYRMNHINHADLTIDRINRRMYFGDEETVYAISYNGDGLQIVLSKPIGFLFYNEPDKTLYWLSPKNQATERYFVTSQKQDPLGPEHIIIQDVSWCNQITVHDQLMYYKTETDRGISVMTLTGDKLPNLGTDQIREDEEAEIILL